MLNRLQRPWGDDGATLSIPKRRVWWHGLRVAYVLRFGRGEVVDCFRLRIVSAKVAKRLATDLDHEHEFQVGPLVIRVAHMKLPLFEWQDEDLTAERWAEFDLWLEAGCP